MVGVKPASLDYAPFTSIQSYLIKQLIDATDLFC